MALTTLLILLVFAFGAAFVQRVTGFGFGIFIMTVLPYIMPTFGEATTLSGLLASVTSLLIVIKMWRFINWRTLLPILGIFLVVSFFAVQFVAITSDSVLKKILGVMLILASVYFFFFSERIKLRPTIPVQFSMGTLSGIMGGLFGMQGPPAVLYFLASTKTKEHYIALTQSYFLIGNAFMTFYRARNGFLTSDVGIAWCYGLAAIFFGGWVGAKVFERMSIHVLRKVVYSYMALSGFVALIS